MFTGPHGAALRHTDWLPLYVLKATISRERLRASTRDTDLKVCTVLWEHTPTGLCGLSFFNNHLDDNAKFSTFVVDGASTSRRNKWAIGEKGKGFTLATQYFFEEVEQTVQPLAQPRSLRPGVSFRIGHQIGELKWKKSKNDADELKVILDDLTPTNLAGLMALRGLNDNEDSSDGSSDPEGDESKKRGKSVLQATIATRATQSLKAIYKRRFKYKMSEKNPAIPEPSSPAHETSFVSKDEVSITVLGLPKSSPSEVFSGIYGILPLEKAWSLPNSQVQFFKLGEDEEVAFYLRDQLVPYGPTLGRLSVNYHGDMMVTSDRRAVMTTGDDFGAYCKALSEAADKAFRHNHGDQLGLATEIALEILEETEGMQVHIARILKPANTESGGGYRAAFKRAWRILNPKATKDAVFWPYPTSHPDDLEIIEELEMVGCAVSDRVMTILEKSGAYTRIRPHTKTLLLAAPEVQDEVPGLERFRIGLGSVLGQDHSVSISMREYSYSTPKILWDPDAREFVFALPDACEEHGEESSCLCWVGPCMFEAIENWKATQVGPGPTMSSICRAYAECMEGVEGMYEPEEEEEEEEGDHPMDDGGTSVESNAAPDPDDVMVKFELLSTQMREFGASLQQRNDTTTAERAQIIELKKQLEEANQNLERERTQLQTSAEAKAQLERERNELEDKLELTQQLLQTQWSTRSEERQAKRRREE
ncbi:hypothetical protein FRC04_006023 [Tulasnella sp. 424]|nr:hypothetical protein FRC04_006023 [Tulasnella sp. 424]